MVGKLRNIHQVVDDPRHDRTGLVLVKKGEGQLLQPLKHIAAHIRLHPHADDMAVVLDEIVQPRFEDVNPQQHPCPNKQQAQILVGDIVVDDVFGDGGIERSQTATISAQNISAMNSFL